MLLNRSYGILLNSGADIVCLQEYAVGTSKNFLTNQKIANALKMYRYRSIIPIGNLRYAQIQYSRIFQISDLQIP